ncbi:glycoside hydrolase family 88 protein [bacterium]|nr:glycoside hydrolase family 88 protein [bacterium]
MKRVIIVLFWVFIVILSFQKYLNAGGLLEKLSYAESKLHNMRVEWSKGWDLTEVEGFINRARSELKVGRISKAEAYIDMAIRIMQAVESKYNSYPSLKVKNEPLALSNLELAKLIAVRTIKNGIVGYSWGQTVAMKGLLATGNWGYVKALVDRYVEKDIKPKNVNECAIGDILLTLYDMFKEEKYLKKAKELGDFILSYKDKLPSGGIVHEPGTRQLWIDTVYMICPFMVRLREPYREEGLRQLYIHIRYLMNPNVFLFHHAWDESTLSLTQHYWARGNGWMLATLVEIFPYVEEEDRNYMEPIIKSMASILSKLQDKSGLWHTLINMRDTYLETSGSALLGYGIHRAIQLGILDKGYMDVVNKTLKGIRARISEEGDVLGVSEGTGPGDYIYYARRKLGVFLHGQGTVLLFLGGFNNE